MSMKKLLIVIGTVLVIFIGAYLHLRTFGIEVSGVQNPQLYPNRALTPGLVATTDFKELTAVSTCGTYSQCHRLTTSSMKSQVCKEYPQNCDGHQEIDHFCPLALGCADDIKNLWAQPEHVGTTTVQVSKNASYDIGNGEDLGFHTKDKLETYLVSQMKAGKITPSDAQQCILKDWVTCFHKYQSQISKQKVVFGAISEDLDGDEVINN